MENDVSKHDAAKHQQFHDFSICALIRSTANQKLDNYFKEITGLASFLFRTK